MSTYFSKLIKAGGKLREFNFKLASVNDDTRYIVDVPDDKGNRVMFSAYKNALGEWKISAQLMPLWIHDTETELGQAIEENRGQEITKKK
jgi:hypothetical protein